MTNPTTGNSFILNKKVSQYSIKWQIPSISSENVSELLELNTVSDSNYK